MNTADYSGLPSSVEKKISPMVAELLVTHAGNIHSFHVTGSAVLTDYDDKISDINSLVVLRELDLKFLAFLAPLGKAYGKKRIAAPLVMTPDYIAQSLDAFPMEFLDFKLIHKTVYGDDILNDLQIAVPNLRLQCEREIKTRLINVRQGYISTLGRRELLSDLLVRSVTGSLVLFRAVITLLGKEPPVPRSAVIEAFGSATGVPTGIIAELLALKAGRSKPSEHELHGLFERYHAALDATGKIIDALPI